MLDASLDFDANPVRFDCIRLLRSPPSFDTDPKRIGAALAAGMPEAEGESAVALSSGATLAIRWRYVDPRAVRREADDREARRMARRSQSFGRHLNARLSKWNGVGWTKFIVLRYSSHNNLKHNTLWDFISPRGCFGAVDFLRDYFDLIKIFFLKGSQPHKLVVVFAINTHPLRGARVSARLAQRPFDCTVCRDRSAVSFVVNLQGIFLYSKVTTIISF